MKSVKLTSSWENTPEDILDQILEKIILLSDFVRFGSVCKTWNRVFLLRKQHRIQRRNNEAPLLYITDLSRWTTNNVIGPEPVFNILNIHNPSDYESLSPVSRTSNIKRDKEKMIVISSYGWSALITKEKEGNRMNLINLITRNSISLPTLPTLPTLPEVKTDLHMYNVVLSCDPSIYPKECVVAFLTQKDTIGVIRLCGNKWTSYTITNQKRVYSIVFHKGQLYALHIDQDLLAIDCFWESSNGDKCDIQTRDVVTIASLLVDFNRMHLVESINGELLLIVRSCITDIKAYKLVISDDGGKKKKGRWDQIQRLCDGEVLFLSGPRNAISSKCRNFEPDSIYYVYNSRDEDNRSYYASRDYDNRSNYVMAVLSLSDERQTSLCTRFGVESEARQPFWINPTLQ